MINGMKNPSPMTIGQCISMVASAILRHGRRHGLESAHPRLPAYAKAWIRRRDRELGDGERKPYHKTASASLACLTGRLIDLLEA